MIKWERLMQDLVILSILAALYLTSGSKTPDLFIASIVALIYIRLGQMGDKTE